MSNPEQPLLVIPDVHLRLDRLKDVLQAWGGRGRVIFLGDFFDDFDDSPETNADMAHFLKEAILGNKDHTVIMGNHDLHYHPQCPPQLRCSGFSEEKMKAIDRVLTLEDFRKFHWATEEGGFLFTHAGLHPRLLPAFAESEPRKLAQWINSSCRNALDTGDIHEPLLRAGYIRYGSQPVGGVIWMDFREYEHIAGVRQIFGHTPLRRHLTTGPDEEASFCIDTHLKCVGVVHPSNREFQVIDFDDKDDLRFPEEAHTPTTIKRRNKGKNVLEKSNPTPERGGGIE